MTQYVTIAVFNATGGSNKTPLGAFTTWYDDLEANASLVSEVFRYKRVLRHCDHLRTGKASHGASDVGVITKKRPRRFALLQVTKYIKRPGSAKPLLWHDRWAIRDVTGRGKRRSIYVSSHAPALIQDHATGRLTKSPGAVEWREHGLPATEALLKRDMDKNRFMVHGGDLNQHESDDPEGPAAMYKRLGMKYRTNGAMWFAWNPKRYALVSEEWRETPPGSDGHKTGVFVLRRL